MPFLTARVISLLLKMYLKKLLSAIKSTIIILKEIINN